MADFVQLLLAGLALGCIYALIALGLILTYSACRMINFAQGELVMLGAYFAVAAVQVAHLPLGLAYVAGVGLTVAVGYLFNQSIFRPLQNQPFIPILIATLGLSLVLKNLARIAWGPEPLVLPSPFGSSTVKLLGATVFKQHLFVIATTLVLLVVQHLVFTYTLLGKKLRAMAEDPGMARLLGIRTRIFLIMAFLVSTALAGAAGVLLAPIIFVTPDMGASVILKAFIAATIGGFGSLPGAIVGGVFLGLSEVFFAGYISSLYKDVFSFALVVAFLVVRPHGFFGERVAEKF